jgi:glycogen debranching enzyme
MSDLRERARAVLRANDRGGYSVPTDGLYPFQWNWDSAFTAMGWATFDEPRAWREFECLLEGQWDDGMVPHIVFHRDDPRYFPGPEVWAVDRRPPTSGITQPPILATAARTVWERASERALADGSVRALYPRLLAYHRWFHRARDPDGTGLVTTYHPWETGMDNSPAWDGPLRGVPVDLLPPYQRRDTAHVDPSQRPRAEEYDRYLTLVLRFRAAEYDAARLYAESPFRVRDVATNAVLHRADRDLLHLARTFGSGAEREEIARWIDAGRRALETLWSDEHRCYLAFDQCTGAPIGVPTSASFLPLFAGTPDAERAGSMMEALDAWCARVRYAVPSADPSAPYFEPRRYWRGPVWLIVNWMIADGLHAYGADRLAGRVRRDSRRLVEGAGFPEYGDPTTGEGLGGGRFTWTAATTLFWLADE